MEVKIESSILSSLCPECGGKTIPIQEKGEIVCSQCGLVISERIVDISHTDKRAFTKQEKEKRERTGSPISILLPDMGLSTIIDKSNIKSPDLKRAAKWNSRMTWDKRNMLIATTELKRMLRVYILHVEKEKFQEHCKKFWMRLL